MVQLKLCVRHFCIFSLPLVTALSVPQKPIAQYSENSVAEQTHDLVADEAGFNITDYTTLDEWNPTGWDYDVVIVGGGPGGLAASMSLARVARTSLLYDSQEYRNAQTRYMHDVLGQDGEYKVG